MWLFDILKDTTDCGKRPRILSSLYTPRNGVGNLETVSTPSSFELAIHPHTAQCLVSRMGGRLVRGIRSRQSEWQSAETKLVVLESERQVSMSNDEA